MTTYVAFLRAINLGAKRQFPKDDIRRAVESVGFTGVQTHINTGNVRFDSRMRSRGRVESTLESAFLADRAFDVPTIAFTATEFRDLARDAAQLSAEHPGLARHYVYLLKESVPPEVADALDGKRSDAGEMVVRDRAVHALLRPGYQEGRVDPLSAVKLLGVTTNRNVTVIQAIAQKWCAA